MGYFGVHNYWPYYWAPMTVLLHIIVTHFTGKALFIVWVVYSVIPTIDHFLPQDHENPTDDEVKILSKQFKWKIPIVVHFAADWFCLYWSLNIQSEVSSWVIWLAILINGAHISAVGFVAAHESFHKRDFVSRFLGTIHMSKSLYMHFYAEHTEGHHLTVATPTDPATSKLNQTLYSFVLQSFFGSFINVWNREQVKLNKKGLAELGIHNRLL